ncbi:hypothetical protein AHF37_02076 [Paragonimus kellicotti]|nr:hypothetical protein AHF37_02076 [Paragonimus kellicotti]
MASSLFRTRPVHLPPPKLYGFASIDRQTEEVLIARLCRPTYAILQARAEANWMQTRRKNLQYIAEMSNMYAVNFTPLTDRQNDLQESSEVETQSTTTLLNSKHSRLFSALRLANLVEDGESTARSEPFVDKSNKLSLSLDRLSELSIQPPVCCCPKGAARSIDPDSYAYNHSFRQMSADWYTVQQIVHRLHETKTTSGKVRIRRLDALQRTPRTGRSGSDSASMCLANHPINPCSVNRPSLFDPNGQFKTQEFISRYTEAHRVSEWLARIARPTTASGLKRRGVCLMCERAPGERNILGIKKYKGIDHGPSINTKKKQANLTQRLQQPTLASKSAQLVCLKAREWNRITDHDLLERKAVPYLSGEAIIRRIAQSAKILPLISGWREVPVYNLSQSAYIPESVDGTTVKIPKIELSLETAEAFMIYQLFSHAARSKIYSLLLLVLKSSCTRLRILCMAWEIQLHGVIVGNTVGWSDLH